MIDLNYLPAYQYDEFNDVHIYNHSQIGFTNFMLVSVYFANHKKVRYVLPFNFNLIRIYRKFSNKCWFVKEVHLF